MSISRKKEFVYTREFLLSLRNASTNPPDGFKEIVLTTSQNQGNRRYTGNHQKTSGNAKKNYKKNNQHQKDTEKNVNNQTQVQNQKRDWEHLNDIRTVCNS